MNPFENMTLEQLLYSLPAFVYNPHHDRMWLHLQPTLAWRTWNAFYGTVEVEGWAIHPVLKTEAETPRLALIELAGLLQLGRFTFKEDPNGDVEKAPKPKLDENNKV